MPTWVPSLIAAVLLLIGSGGLLALLRFQRQEAGKTLAQYQVILGSMQTIVDEATEGFERMRAQRDHLERELRNCTSETSSLRGELARWRWEQRDGV